MPHIQILLSTYNGEKYLAEQLDSLLAQKDVEVSLTVRDDGSTDGTLQILHEYEARANVRIIDDGERLGPARSFMRLLKIASRADYYAFCDQDDYWLPDKLAAAATKLAESGERPALYFCQTTLVNENLQPLPHQKPISPLLTYGESLVYQFIGGCTMVMNNALRSIVNAYTPTTLFMHDVWIYSVCLSVGANVFFDPKSHILYRQHGGNVVGQGNHTTELKRRFKRVLQGKHERYKTARELLQGYAGEMTPENLSLTRDYLAAKTNPLKRIRLLTDKRLATSNPPTTRAFRIALLLGTY